MGRELAAARPPVRFDPLICMDIILLNERACEIIAKQWLVARDAPVSGASNN